VPLASASELVHFEEIQQGQVFRTSETFGYSAMSAFAQLSGDFSPIHTDTEVAKRFSFPDRLQYGFLLASLLSRIVGSNFHHAVCASVSLDFTKPVPAQARVEVTAEVVHIQLVMRTVSLRITMSSNDSVVTRGKLTTIFLPEHQGQPENCHVDTL
jgi:3-hydroxybutyryl-CoA dehydratase